MTETMLLCYFICLLFILISYSCISRRSNRGNICVISGFLSQIFSQEPLLIESDYQFIGFF